jgi:hypothetical protein
MSDIVLDPVAPEAYTGDIKHIKAASLMAEFFVLASVDPGTEPLVLDQIAGSFVLANQLAYKERDLRLAMKVNLVRAGLEERDATSLSGFLSSQSFLERVAARDFIHEHRPDFGLRMGKEKAVNQAKFIGQILKLGQR